MASFQLKSFVAVAASMINRMKATQTTLTDFNVGAIARTLVEAPAIEIEELYQQAFNMVTAAIPVSVFNSFNFAAIAAAGASGTVRVSITAQSSDTLISAGTTFSSTATSTVFSSQSDATIAAGATYVDVSVTATTTGTTTNIAAGASFTMTPSPNGYVSASNVSAFVNGRDAESDADRLIRFNSYIVTLSRATVNAIEYGLSTVTVSDSAGNVTEQVKLYKVVEPYLTDATQPIAQVNAYIHNGVGSTSSALLTQASKVIAGYTNSTGTKVAGYKAAGVPVTLYLATEVPLAVTGTIELEDDDTYDFDTVMEDVETAIYTYLQDLDINASAINSEMVALAKAVDGVYDFKLTSPTDNTAVSVGEKIMPGTLTFTQVANSSDTTTAVAATTTTSTTTDASTATSSTGATS